MAEDPLSDVIGRVLREAPFAMRQLAADSSLSYDVLRSWRSGRRRPSRASAQRLAEGLERRGERLLTLARELRMATNGRTDTIAIGRAAAPEPAAQAASGRVDSPPTIGRESQPTSGRESQPTSGRESQPTSGREAQPTSGRESQPTSGRESQPTSGRGPQPTPADRIPFGRPEPSFRP